MPDVLDGIAQSGLEIKGRNRELLQELTL